MKSIKTKIQHSIQIQVRNYMWVNLKDFINVKLYTLINEITTNSIKINWMIEDKI